MDRDFEPLSVSELSPGDVILISGDFLESSLPGTYRAFVKQVVRVSTFKYQMCLSLPEKDNLTIFTKQLDLHERFKVVVTTVERPYRSTSISDIRAGDVVKWWAWDVEVLEVHRGTSKTSITLKDPQTGQNVVHTYKNSDVLHVKG